MVVKATLPMENALVVTTSWSSLEKEEYLKTTLEVYEKGQRPNSWFCDYALHGIDLIAELHAKSQKLEALLHDTANLLVDEEEKTMYLRKWKEIAKSKMMFQENQEVETEFNLWKRKYEASLPQEVKDGKRKN